VTTVLVTGAGGHVGRRVTRRLAADGVTVRAFVRTPKERWPTGVEQIVGDVARDQSLLEHAAGDADLLVHLAGASEDALRQNPGAAVAESVTGAQNVAASGAPAIVYLSTVHVYGSALVPGALIDETTPADPLSGYAQARLTCEEVLRKGDAPTSIFRLTNGLGAPLDPDQSGWQVVSNELCRLGATEHRLVLRSSGVQWRDFVPLVDVEACLSALAARPEPLAGTFNFASGTSITVRDLATEIQACFAEAEGTAPTLEMPPMDHTPSDPYRVDITRLQDLHLFVPTPRRLALQGVVQDCLARRRELAGSSASA
jgi:UDP-glucose 4-epimerase